MKKIISAVLAAMAINAVASDVTNTVTIITNIYRRIGEKHYVTNVTVNLDVSQQAINYARGYANAASASATTAQGYANDAASHVTDAQSAAADAEYYAEQAHGQVQPIIDEGERQLAAVQAAGNTQTGRVTSEGNYQVGRVNSAGSSNVGSVNSAGTTALNNINSRQQWFEQHFGQMVTNVNIYYDEDQVARAGVAQNASDISALNTRMGTAEGSIGSLGTRMGTAETNIGNLNTSVSGLSSRMGTVERNIGSTKTTLENLANQHTNEVDSLRNKIRTANDYTTSVSNKLEIEIQNVATSKVEKVEDRLEEIEALSFKSYPDPVNGGKYKFLIHNQRTPEYVFYLTIDTKKHGEYRSNVHDLGNGVIYFDQNTKFPSRAHQPANHCKVETVSGVVPDVIWVCHFIGQSAIEPHVSDRLIIGTGNYNGSALSEYLIDSLDTSSNRMILPTSVRPSNCYLEVFISANRTSRFDLIDEEFASLSNWVERTFQKK